MMQYNHPIPENNHESKRNNDISPNLVKSVKVSYEYINKECCCFNLRKAMRALTQYYDRCLEPVKIRSTQFSLLVALDSIKAKTLTEIAETLVMDRTTLTRNLKPLAKLGLITIVQTTDKRSKAYVLTEEGKNLLVTCVPLWQVAQDNVIKSIGKDNYLDLFNKIENLLNRLGLFK